MSTAFQHKASFFIENHAIKYQIPIGIIGFGADNFMLDAKKPDLVHYFTTDDTKDIYDVFIRNAQESAPLVSTSSNSTEDAGHNNQPSVSTDWHNVANIAFESDTSNLVTGDTKDIYDVFIKNIQKQKESAPLVSTSSNSAEDAGHNERYSVSADWGNVAVVEENMSNLALIKFAELLTLEHTLPIVFDANVTLIGFNSLDVAIASGALIG